MGFDTHFDWSLPMINWFALATYEISVAQFHPLESSERSLPIIRMRPPPGANTVYFAGSAAKLSVFRLRQPELLTEMFAGIAATRALAKALVVAVIRIWHKPSLAT
jgi:hypothetical protein